MAKSTPAPIAGHRGVRALMSALAHQDADSCEAPLPARIAMAVKKARGDGSGVDAAALSEASGWLAALAGTGGAAGDEALLREQVALSTEADFRDPRADRVSLLTMHAAKGLEFALDEPAGALAHGHHGRYGGNADDDAQDGETGPHLVLRQGAKGDANGDHESKALSSFVDVAAAHVGGLTLVTSF